MTKQKRRRFTEEFKREAVRLVTDQGYSFGEAGRSLGVRGDLISRWKRRFEAAEESSGRQVSEQQRIRELEAEDLIEQDFAASEPNEKWVSDITYVWTDEGWLYLATVMDLYSRAIVGWSMNRRMTQQLAIDALTMALFRRGFPRETIIHSDRGSQYCSAAYQRLINHNGLRCSMGRRANCYDNAAMESFFHTLKVELIHRERYRNRAAARRAIFEYIESYYNRQRKHSAIGNRIPMLMEDAA